MCKFIVNIINISVICLTLTLNACTFGNDKNSNNGDNNVKKNEVYIDQIGTLYSIDGQKTKYTIYIHNNSQKTYNNLIFDGFDANEVGINSQACKSISANSLCELTVFIKTDNSSISAQKLNITDGSGLDVSRIISYKKINSDSSNDTNNSLKIANMSEFLIDDAYYLSLIIINNSSSQSLNNVDANVDNAKYATKQDKIICGQLPAKSTCTLIFKINEATKMRFMASATLNTKPISSNYIDVNFTKANKSILLNDYSINLNPYNRYQTIDIINASMYKAEELSIINEDKNVDITHSCGNSIDKYAKCQIKLSLKNSAKESKNFNLKVLDKFNNILIPVSYQIDNNAPNIISNTPKINWERYANYGEITQEIIITNKGNSTLSKMDLNILDNSQNLLTINNDDCSKKDLPENESCKITIRLSNYQKDIKINASLVINGYYTDYWKHEKSYGPTVLTDININITTQSSLRWKENYNNNTFYIENNNIDSVKKDFYIVNDGSQPASISENNIKIDNPNIFDIKVSNCENITKNTLCTITLTFGPTDKETKINSSNMNVFYETRDIQEQKNLQPIKLDYGTFPKERATIKKISLIINNNEISDRDGSKSNPYNIANNPDIIKTLQFKVVLENTYGNNDLESLKINLEKNSIYQIINGKPTDCSSSLKSKQICNLFVTLKTTDYSNLDFILPIISYKINNESYEYQLLYNSNNKIIVNKLSLSSQLDKNSFNYKENNALIISLDGCRDGCYQKFIPNTQKDNTCLIDITNDSNKCELGINNYTCKYKLSSKYNYECKNGIIASNIYLKFDNITTQSNINLNRYYLFKCKDPIKFSKYKDNDYITQMYYDDTRDAVWLTTYNYLHYFKHNKDTDSYERIGQIYIDYSGDYYTGISVNPENQNIVFSKDGSAGTAGKSAIMEVQSTSSLMDNVFINKVIDCTNDVTSNKNCYISTYNPIKYSIETPSIFYHSKMSKIYFDSKNNLYYSINNDWDYNNVTTAYFYGALNKTSNFDLIEEWSYNDPKLNYAFSSSTISTHLSALEYGYYNSKACGIRKIGKGSIGCVPSSLIQINLNNKEFLFAKSDINYTPEIVSYPNDSFNQSDKMTVIDKNDFTQNYSGYQIRDFIYVNNYSNDETILFGANTLDSKRELYLFQCSRHTDWDKMKK